MSFRALLAFLSILSVTSGLSVASERMFVQHSRLSAPAGFVSQGAAPATEILNIRLALASNNLAGLQQKLDSVSTPGSSEFRQWLSKDEVGALLSAYSLLTPHQGDILRPTFCRDRRCLQQLGIRKRHHSRCDLAARRLGFHFCAR